MNGYRTILALAIGLALQAASGKGLISHDAATAVDAGAVSDAALQVYASVAMIVGVFFRLKASKPGALAPKETP